MDMVMDQSTFERVIRPAVEREARKRFRNDPDCEAKIADAVSVAWEFCEDAKQEAYAVTIARFSVRRVVSDRQFRQSSRSIIGPNPERRKKPKRVDYDLDDYGRRGENPADIAAVKIDFMEWFATDLNSRDQAVCLAFLRGDRTYEVAEQFDISLARVSQLRREFVGRWEAFTA
jgi:hypothetical protein